MALQHSTSPAAYITTEYLQKIRNEILETLPEVVEAVTEEFWFNFKNKFRIHKNFSIHFHLLWSFKNAMSFS